MKQIVLFGSGTVAEKNLNKNPSFIVDNNKDLHGTNFRDVPVVSPEVLRNRRSEFFVIICTTSLDAVLPQLEELGYVADSDMKIADQLVDLLAVERLVSLKPKFLISSGLPSHVSDFSGGGVFMVEDSENTVEIKKVFSGNVHGLIKGHAADYYFNAQGDGVYALDKHTLTPNRLFEVPTGYRPHGIAEYGNNFLMVSSYQDAIVLISEKGIIERTYEISGKKDHFGSAQHHCNDITVVEDFAYISMFSISGNWKRGRFDGGIVELDLITGGVKTICTDLTMPHNVSTFGGELRVLNSFKGEILLNNFEKFGTLPGFVRGLDEDEEFLYVGESKNRNFSRLNANRSPVSLDTRITVIDKSLRCSKSVALPNSISEIHSIVRVA